MSSKWSWEHSNGGASDAQTKAAFDALMSKGRTSEFSHFVWNDLVESTHALLITNGLSWDDEFGTYEKTLIGENGTLSAKAFNSLRNNIFNTGWPWSYNKDRPDYLGKEDAARGDLIYASYFLELAHKYNVMFGILDDTAGTPVTASSPTDQQIQSAVNLIAMRGIMLGLLTDTSITDETAAEVIAFLPTILTADCRMNIETKTDADISTVLFGMPKLNGAVDIVAENFIKNFMVRISSPVLTEEFHLKTSQSCDMESESSDDLEIICREFLRIYAALEMLRLRSYSVRGGTWKSRITSHKQFLATFVRSVLTSISALISNVNSSCAFALCGQTHAVVLPRKTMRSDLSSESSFEGRWAVSEKMNGGKMLSEIGSESAFMLRLCTEILMKGCTLESIMGSDFVGQCLSAYSSPVGNGDFFSEISGHSCSLAESLAPSSLGKMSVSSDISASGVILSDTAKPCSTAVNPYTIRVETHNQTEMKSEGNMKCGSWCDDLQTMHLFVISSEIDVSFEEADAVHSDHEFVGEGLAVSDLTKPETAVLVTDNFIEMVVATAWIYPVQTEDDLFIVQARTIDSHDCDLTLT